MLRFFEHRLGDGMKKEELPKIVRFRERCAHEGVFMGKTIARKGFL
jgi:hypothetical protein